MESGMWNLHICSLTHSTHDYDFMLTAMLLLLLEVVVVGIIAIDSIKKKTHRQFRFPSCNE